MHHGLRLHSLISGATYCSTTQLNNDNVCTSGEQRQRWLDGSSNGIHHDVIVDAALDELAAELEKVVAIDRLIAIAREAA